MLVCALHVCLCLRALLMRVCLHLRMYPTFLCACVSGKRGCMCAHACMHKCVWLLIFIVVCHLFHFSLLFVSLSSPLVFFLWSLFLGTLFLHCFSGFSVFDRSLNYVKDFQSKPAKKLNTRCPPSWDNLHYKSMWINRDQRLKVLVSEVCTGTEMYGRCKIWSTTVDWKCQIQNQDIPK